jgi:hypothetical protein
VVLMLATFVRPTAARIAIPPVFSGVIARGNLLRRAGPFLKESVKREPFFCG